MEDLIFVRPDESMQQAVSAYRREHFSFGEREMYGAAWLDQVTGFSKWLEIVRANANAMTVRSGWVLSSTMCVLRKSDRMLVGMVDIHHTLNPFLKMSGGHISFGVRPTMRGRGYGTKILNLALRYCSDVGIASAQVSCAQNNAAAIKCIKKNGGTLMSSYPYGSVVMQRFHIETAIHQPRQDVHAAGNRPWMGVHLPDGRAVTVRGVEYKDAKALAALFRQTERESIYLSREPDEIRVTARDAEQTITQVQNDPRRHWLVAVLGDEIIARCGINRSQQRERFSHCCSIEIELLRAYWNCGIGSYMIDIALGWAVEHGYEQAHVYMNASDERTIHVFRKFGFKEMGRVPKGIRYQDVTYADLLLMGLQME